MVSALVIHLENLRTVEPRHQLVVPFFIRIGFVGEGDVDPDRVGSRGLGRVVGQVEVQCFEHDAPTVPEILEASLQSVQHRGLPAVVLSDEDRDSAEVETEAL